MKYPFVTVMLNRIKQNLVIRAEIVSRRMVRKGLKVFSPSKVPLFKITYGEKLQFDKCEKWYRWLRNVIF